MASTRTAAAIRPVESAELTSWLRLVNQFRYWQDDLEALRFDDTLRPAGEPILRLGAWTADGTLVGVAEAALSEDGSRYAARASGLVGVAPEHRRRGLGTRLADEVERFAETTANKWVEAEVREINLPAALPFVRQRGYVELERYRTSVQTPSTVDLSGLAGLQSRLEREGVEFVTLPAIDSARARDELYQSTMQIWRDMPHEAHVDWHDPTRETFIRSIFERPSVLLDGFYVAREGERIVGLSYLTRRPDGNAEVGETVIPSLLKQAREPCPALAPRVPYPQGQGLPRCFDKNDRRFGRRVHTSSAVPRSSRPFSAGNRRGARPSGG